MRPSLDSVGMRFEATAFYVFSRAATERSTHYKCEERRGVVYTTAGFSQFERERPQASRARIINGKPLSSTRDLRQ